MIGHVTKGCGPGHHLGVFQALHVDARGVDGLADSADSAVSGLLGLVLCEEVLANPSGSVVVVDVAEPFAAGCPSL